MCISLIANKIRLQRPLIILMANQQNSHMGRLKNFKLAPEFIPHDINQIHRKILMAVTIKSAN